jgi:molybdate transport system substrate-binding protein
VAWAAAVLCSVAALVAHAREDTHDVRVAVAANFKQAAEELCDAYFKGRAGHCVVTAGATGLLYAKATQGAPFDVFLSADRSRAEQLERDGLGVAGTRFTYAVGRLVLWQPGRAIGSDLRSVLVRDELRTIAIANPGSAPYGVAAMETLRALGIDVDGRYRIVRGEGVAQAFQFAATGAADAAFVALSQVLEYGAATGRSLEDEVLIVDPSLHRPIEQQAVLLEVARRNPAARGFLEFMRSAAARSIIDAAGYTTTVP